MDFSDIPVDVVKMFLYLKFDVITGVLLFFTLLIWVYFRVYCLVSLGPAGLNVLYVYSDCIFRPYEINTPKHQWFVILYQLLILLFHMNIYWIFMFTRILYRAIKYFSFIIDF